MSCGGGSCAVSERRALGRRSPRALYICIPARPALLHKTTRKSCGTARARVIIIGLHETPGIPSEQIAAAHAGSEIQRCFIRERWLSPGPFWHGVLLSKPPFQLGISPTASTPTATPKPRTRDLPPQSPVTVLRRSK